MLVLPTTEAEYVCSLEKTRTAFSSSCTMTRHSTTWSCVRPSGEQRENLPLRQQIESLFMPPSESHVVSMQSPLSRALAASKRARSSFTYKSRYCSQLRSREIDLHGTERHGEWVNDLEETSPGALSESSRPFAQQLAQVVPRSPFVPLAEHIFTAPVHRSRWQVEEHRTRR